MNIRTKATAGTQEKGDILLSVAPLCPRHPHRADFFHRVQIQSADPPYH